MNSLTQAAALVPAPAREESPQPLLDSIEHMDLEDLIAALILPKDEEEYVFNLVGVVRHFSKKSSVSKKELTAGAIETMREMQELNEAADKHEGDGIHILKRIAKWGIHKIVKYVFKLALRLMLRFARWIFKEIIINGIKALVEWVVRPMLMEILGFIGVNPELWPFVAIGGGIAALGYTGWKMFFDKSKDGTPTKVDEDSADSLDATREEAMAGVTNEGLYETPVEAEAPTTEVTTRGIAPTPTVAGKAQGFVAAPRAAAPVPAGAPVAMPTGTVDKMALYMLKKHEGYKTRPYRDSQGYWTIGIGHLITKDKGPLPPEWDREFSDQEVLAIFSKDYDFHKKAAEQIPGFSKLDALWQASLIDITFNMGPAWWHSWKIFQQELMSMDLKGALQNLMGSLWAKQTKSRATDIIGMLTQDLGSKDQTQSAPAQSVSQTPAVTMPKPNVVAATPQGTTSVASASTTPPVSTSRSAGSIGQGGSSGSSTPAKDYINGPRGSLIAVS